jgi:hypothetical protein
VATTPAEAYAIAGRLSRHLRERALPRIVQLSVEIPSEVIDLGAVRLVAHLKLPNANGKYVTFRVPGDFVVGDHFQEADETRRLSRDAVTKLQKIQRQGQSFSDASEVAE